MRDDWKKKDFKESYTKTKKTNKINKRDYLDDGKYPIVAQGDELISGYWNRREDVFEVDRPVIVFGDHTRNIKYIDFDFVRGADGIKVLNPIKDIYPKFYYYYLKSLNIKNLGYARHFRILKKKKVCYPPLKEQKRIVAILDEAFGAIDRAKANIERNIANAEELFESKLNEIFFQRGINWEQKRLDQICENLDRIREPISKKKRKSGPYPYYGASGIVDYVDDYIFDEQLLLVSEDGANLLARTYPIAFSIDGKAWINNHVHVLRFENFTSQKFVENYLESIKLNEYISGMAQPKLNQKSLNSIPIPFPDITVQKEIVEEIENLKEKKRSISDQYELKFEFLDELKKSILQQAFSGALTRPDSEFAGLGDAEDELGNKAAESVQDYGIQQN